MVVRRRPAAKAAAAPAKHTRTAATAAPARRGRPAAKEPNPVQRYAEPEAVTEYHKAKARYIMNVVGYDPKGAPSALQAFLRGVAISTLVHAEFGKSPEADEWRAANGVKKRGPVAGAQAEEEEAPAPRRRGRPAKAVAVVEPEIEEDDDEFDDDVDDDGDEFEDDDDDSDSDDFDDEDTDDSEDETDEFDDEDAEEEAPPAPVKRGPGRPRKNAAAPVKAAPATRARKAAPAKTAPAKRTRAAAQDDEILF